jgi:hypothetical protein
MDENTATQIDAILGLAAVAETPAPSESEVAPEASLESSTPEAPPETAAATTPVKLAKTKEVLERARIERERRKMQTDIKSAQEEASKAAVEQLKELARRDPVQFFRDVVGLDAAHLKDVAAPLYYDHLGDKAPEELRRQNERVTLERKIADLEKRLEARDQEILSREQQREVTQYIGSIATFVEAKPEDFPLLSAEYESDNETVTQALQQEAVRYYQETGVVASPKQVAQSLESALELHYQNLQRAYAKKTKQPTAKSPPAPPPTSSPSDAALADSPAKTAGGFDRERAEQQVYALLEGR